MTTRYQVRVHTYILVEFLPVVVYEGEGQGHAQGVQLEGVGTPLSSAAAQTNS
jgi:hypothetical protein